MEYLKNVVLKVWNNILGTHSCLQQHPSPRSLSHIQFLHTAGPEQASLLPVITQLLRLSPQEVKFLQETIKGN